MKSDRIDSMKALRLPAVLLVILLLPMAAVAQQSFDSPQAALDALRAAMQVQDKEALQRIFGPQLDDLRSGDPVQDATDIEAFARRLKAAAVLEPAGEDQRTLLVGPEGHPFAVPIVRRDGKWTFDTAGGKEELLNRRIGQNELGAVSVCRAYVVAQREYYLDGAAGTGVPEYAQRLMSMPGKRDGLYWQTGPDEPLSPLGPLVARAQAAGYASQKDQPAERSQPYHGYVYRILVRQDQSAPGGKYDYIINDHMVAGFAMLAYPVSYGSSGVMTFLVGPAGTVCQKDLGERTAELSQRLKEYSPDDSWTPVED